MFNTSTDFSLNASTRDDTCVQLYINVVPNQKTKKNIPNN